MARGAEQPAIYLEIVCCHPRSRKTLLKLPPHIGAVESKNLRHGTDRLVRCIHHLARGAVIDNLSRCSSVEGDDRRATGHGLKHDETKTVQASRWETAARANRAATPSWSFHRFHQ